VDPLFWRILSRGTVETMRKMSGLDAIRAVADLGSATLWEGQFAHYVRDSDEYERELMDARRATGVDESVVTGAIRVGGVEAVVISWEFGFLGGSVGVGTAARIVAAIRAATTQGLPLLALPRSGGTRMQEGAPAFVQMVAIAGAVAEHRAAGLPYLVHLCGPTTGGVLATLGSAGDLTTAEPDAMIGFLGPRAYSAITGEQFPEGVQTAENLLARGLVDAVLPWEEVGPRWATLLSLWADRPIQHREVLARPASPEGPGPASIPGAPTTAAELWAYVEASREPDRMDAEQLMATHMTDVVVLPGTGAGERSHGAVVALGRLLGMPVVVAATEDRRTGQALTVGGLRTIRRGIDLAGQWGLPVVTIVDTLGAQLSVEGEQSGIAGEISRVMVDLVAAPVPTAALLLGAGTGGAALALLASDRIVAGSHTWVSPLAPEGAAAIRHGGTHDPAQIAWEQRIGAHALAGLGFVDTLVRESEPDWAGTAAQAVVDNLREVLGGVGTRRRVERFTAWNAASTA
jgi:acetyl-CoA carboxylase carboxyl transferase subunit beta